MSVTGFGMEDWRDGLRDWVEPFVAALGRSEQRHWAALYLQGLLGPGARKSVEPMAERVCPGQTQQLHHFVATSPWACEPLERVLRRTGDALVGGDDAVLIVDDTALLKQGRHSVGVKHQYCGLLGQAGQLPGAGIADAGARGSARAYRFAAVPARRLGER